MCEFFLISCLCVSPPLLPPPQPQTEACRPHVSRLDLEQWYRELMAGPSQLHPPALPARSQSGGRPVLQVDAFLFLFQLSAHAFFCCSAFISRSCMRVCVCVCYMVQNVAVVTPVGQLGAIEEPETRKMQNVRNLFRCRSPSAGRRR